MRKFLVFLVLFVGCDKKSGTQMGKEVQQNKHIKDQFILTSETLTNGNTVHSEIRITIVEINNKTMLIIDPKDSAQVFELGKSSEYAEYPTPPPPGPTK